LIELQAPERFASLSAGCTSQLKLNQGAVAGTIIIKFVTVILKSNIQSYF